MSVRASRAQWALKLRSMVRAIISMSELGERVSEYLTMSFLSTVLCTAVPQGHRLNRRASPGRIHRDKLQSKGKTDTLGHHETWKYASQASFQLKSPELPNLKSLRNRDTSPRSRANQEQKHMDGSMVLVLRFYVTQVTYRPLALGFAHGSKKREPCFEKTCRS